MTISGLSQAEWAVYVLSAGALALSTTDASLLSVDSVIASARGLKAYRRDELSASRVVR